VAAPLSKRLNIGSARGQACVTWSDVTLRHYRLFASSC